MRDESRPEDLLLRILPDGRAEFHLFVAGSPANVDLKTPAPVPTDRWFHLAGVYDRRSMRLYADGALEAERLESRAVRSSGGALWIGAVERDGGLWPPLRGVIDELALIPRGLSAGEVMELREDPGSFRSEAVALDTFEREDGEILRDASPAEHHGRLGRTLVADERDPRPAAGRR